MVNVWIQQLTMKIVELVAQHVRLLRRVLRAHANVPVTKPFVLELVPIPNEMTVIVELVEPNAAQVNLV